MADYCRVYGMIHFTSPAGWLPVHRDQLRAQRSVTSMGKLYLYSAAARPDAVGLSCRLSVKWAGCVGADNAMYGRLRWRSTVDLARKTHRCLLRHSRHLFLRSARRKLCSFHGCSQDFVGLSGVFASRPVRKGSFTQRMRCGFARHRAARRGGAPRRRHIRYERTLSLLKRTVSMFEMHTWE